MTGDELRQSFLNFFAERGHAIIPSASLVPENDPTALFISAGMHPLVPYLLGESHPEGRRLTDVQKCLRTDDIEEVGDISHNTFFEMLGFWSLGDYWKQDSLRWTLEWFTRVLGLEQERISVTVFAGDSNAPRDDEAVQVWLELGIGLERTLCVHQRTSDIYTTDLFRPIVQRINTLRKWQDSSISNRPGSEVTLSGSKEKAALSIEQELRLIRIIADHVRAATF